MNRTFVILSGLRYSPFDFVISSQTPEKRTRSSRLPGRNQLKADESAVFVPFWEEHTNLL